MTTDLSFLSWGKTEHGIQTARGVRAVTKAPATPQFWQLWRNPETKAQLQAAGVTCKPGQDGEWVVVMWSDSVPCRVCGQHGSADLCAACAKDAGGNAEQFTRAQVAEPVTAAPTGEAADWDCGSSPQARPTLKGDLSKLDLTVKWSDEQLAIFNYFATGTGNLVVQARAGTGKTTTIKQAFAVAPEQDMLYAVFNKKNQKEALAKITDPRVDVKTLHGLGYSYIRSVWRDAKPDDSVETDRVVAVVGDERDDVVNAVLKLVGFAKNLFASVPTVADLMQLAIDRDIFVDDDEESPDRWTDARVAEAAVKAMEKAKVKDPAGRISFNDMVWLPVVMGWVRARYDLVVIDEAQDMNLPQLLMATKACRKGGRIVVVGDDRQAIYGFRGAAQDGMGMMKARLNAATLGLTVTYRCPKSVVALAAQTVPDYRAADSAPEGVVANCSEVEMLDAVRVGDAIISRINAPLMSTCLQLLKKGVPARIEGKDIGRQLVGMVRKLKARSVPDFFKRLARWEDKQLSRLRNAKNAEAKTAAVRDQRETLEALAEGCASVAEIESRLLSLFQDSDEQSRPAVVLTSVHKAKGLEWDSTYLLDWTFARKAKTPAERQEEANIFYVAVTRAKRQLNRVSQGGTPKQPADQGDGTKAGAV